MSDSESENIETFDQVAEEASAHEVRDEKSKLSGLALFLLAVIPMIAVAAYGSVDPWALGIQAILIAALLIVWMADLLVRGRLEINFNASALPLLALILIGVFQILPLFATAVPESILKSEVAGTISLDPFATRFAVIQLSVYLLYFLAAMHFLNRARRLRGMVYVIIIFCSAAAFFGILQFLAKPEAIYGLRPTPWAEPFGPYVNKHHFAALMEMSFGVTLALFLGHQNSREKKMLLLIAMILAGISIVLTGSRGGFLSVTVVALFVVAASVISGRRQALEQGSASNRSSNLISSGLFLVTIAALVVGSVLMLGGDQSLVRGLGGVNSEDFSTGRTHFWQITWEIIKDNPIIGVGLDSLAVAFTRHDTWNGTVRVEQSHNDYLHVMAEAGVIGLLAVVSFIVIVFKKGIRNIGEHVSGFPRSMVIGSLGGLLGILVHSFFDFPLRTPANGFFFLLLAVFATSDVRFEKRQRERRRRKNDEGRGLD
jgi:O-antigen ligase